MSCLWAAMKIPLRPLSLFLVLCTRDDEEENGEDKKCGKCEEMENIL